MELLHATLSLLLLGMAMLVSGFLLLPKRLNIRPNEMLTTKEQKESFEVLMLGIAKTLQILGAVLLLFSAVLFFVIIII